MLLLDGTHFVAIEDTITTELHTPKTPFSLPLHRTTVWCGATEFRASD
jgi:hypothetical protein